MGSFKDSNGNSWNIVLNIGNVMKVQEALDINLLEPGGKASEEEDTLIVKIMTNDVLFSKIISALCYEDIVSKYGEGGDNLFKFYEALDGQALLNAEEVFLKEYDRFFMGRDREAMRLFLKNVAEVLKTYRASQAQEFGKLQESVELATQGS